MKTRDFKLEIKKLEDNGTFEGYASVFGVRDSYNEVVEAGAFAKSLARHVKEKSRPLLLWQHNPDEPLGVWSELTEDKRGLWGRGELTLGVRRADEAYLLLKAGAVQGLSIGYREVDTEAATEGKPRILRELDLIEASIVSFPANRRARVEAVKSDERLQDFARRLRDGEPLPVKDFEDILRDAGIPKSMATKIASVGYANAIRSESEGPAITLDLGPLQEAIRAFSNS